MRFSTLCAALCCCLIVWGGNQTAEAINGWTAGSNVGATRSTCFQFDDNQSAAVTFKIDGAAASGCHVKDSLASGGTAVVSVYSCPTPAASTATTCPILEKTYSVDECVDYSRGKYLLTIGTAASSGDQAEFCLQGIDLK